MNNILGKFDNIKINNNSRITVDDQIFCEKQEVAYKEFIKFTDDYLQYLNINSLSNIFYNSNNLINEMNKNRNNKKDQFIEKIVDYFRNQYEVTLKHEPIEKKYDININYNIIIDEIIEQLGGYNFTDKAEKEIKDEFKNILRYDKIKIKNKKISIDNFFYIDSWDLKYKYYKVNYNSYERFYKLFKALSHFIYRSNKNLFQDLYDTITQKRNDKVFKTHDIHNNDIIKTLKVYKNGKIDLEFNNPDHMRKFAKEYCGYVG